MSMPKTVQIVPSTICFDTKIRERKGGISGETQEQKRSYLGKIKPNFNGGGRVFGLSTLFQTNFFRLFFRYCTGV